ncbi:hypothetical protein DVH05_023555 [Phytophthora capsici]|nr:hypothetical protein DVH05_023555 [Phytophthora capsici]
MDDLPIIELLEHYFIDGKRLGMAIAHVSAQTNSIAEHQAELRRRQSLYEEEQQRFIEQRVSAAREEAEARNNALVLAIKQTYGDPSTLELRVDARIQDILQQLQHGAQEQAEHLLRLTPLIKLRSISSWSSECMLPFSTLNRRLSCKRKNVSEICAKKYTRSLKIGF